MGYGKIGLEQHMDQILRGSEVTWKNYKKYLAYVYTFLRDRRSPRINVEEGDAYIRFQTLTDDCGLNKTYFLFEIGDLFPQIRWRNLIRQTLTSIPVVLHKRVCFLPVYSYSLDRFFTLVYWGEEQFFLDPDQLKKFNIKSFLFTIPRPSSTSISIANFAWLKSVEKVWCDSKAILELSKHYIFNALHPPDLTNEFSPWYEAPFILVGNRLLEIFTIHKTICYLDLSTIIKSKMGHFFKLRSYMLDNKLNVRKTYCLLSEDYLPFIEKKPMTEAIVIKYIKVYDKETFKKPVFETFIYPFESSNLLGNEAPGLLMTAISIVLRYLYLNSSDPLRLQTTQEEVRRKVLSIFRHPPFNQYKWDEFVSHIFQHAEEIAFIIQCLDIYHTIKNALVYLHPSIIESLSILYGDFDHLLTMKDGDLKNLIIHLLEIIEYIKHYQENIYEINHLINIKEIIKDKFGFYVSYDLLKRFILSLIIICKSMIPISKFLSLPRPLQFHDYKSEVNES
jgi:hypothetical protein